MDITDLFSAYGESKKLEGNFEILVVERLGGCDWSVVMGSWQYLNSGRANHPRGKQSINYSP